MRSWSVKFLAGVVLLGGLWCGRGWASDGLNVPPYSLSILNVVVRPNDTHINVVKGLYLKGGYILTAYHVVEQADNARWLSTGESPMWASQDIVDDKPLDFSILKLKDTSMAGRFTEYFGGFGSSGVTVGDGVYYFKNDSDSEVQNDVISQHVLETRNATGHILISGGVPQGYSGSPVFSAKTQKLVGMIVFGDPHVTELLPIEAILARVGQVSQQVVTTITGESAPDAKAGGS